MVTKSVPAEELDEYVEWIANRVALTGYETLSLYKEAVNSVFEVLGMEAMLKTGMVFNHLAHGTDRAREFFGRLTDSGIRDAVAWRDDPFGGPQRRGESLPLLVGPPKPDEKIE